MLGWFGASLFSEDESFCLWSLENAGSHLGFDVQVCVM